MSTSVSLPSVTFWDIFIRNPKGSSNKVVQGAHRFLSDVIKGTEQSPINSVFINLFDQFTTTPVKKYVYQRMTKKILQELALRMLQEIIAGGPTRANNLQLEVEETRSGGKTVVIKETTDEFPVDEDFVRDIDEAFFSIGDSTGFSPQIRLASGQGRVPPYFPPDENGNFTPKKAQPRSLEAEFEVSASPELLIVAFDNFSNLIPAIGLAKQAVSVVSTPPPKCDSEESGVRIYSNLAV